MYESFYKFDKAPFTNIPDPELLFLSPQHKHALSILQYALMARAGFCVITGDVGAGKTTLVRSVIQSLDFEVEVGLVSNTQCDSFEEFLRWILLAFDLDQKDQSKVELYDTFVKYLIEQHSKGRPVTLIIDEAQHLGYAYLEQLRMMSNVNTEKGLLLQTILVGQPELWDLLRSPELEQFAQRISYDYFLEPLGDADLTRQYIQHRIEKVGGNINLFAEDTYEEIWVATGGVPRLINLLCDTALVYGYADNQETIGISLVHQVIDDKRRSFSPIGKKPLPRPGAINRSLQQADSVRAESPSIAAGASTQTDSTQSTSAQPKNKIDLPAKQPTAPVHKLSTIERAAQKKKINREA